MKTRPMSPTSSTLNIAATVIPIANMCRNTGENIPTRMQVRMSIFCLRAPFLLGVVGYARPSRAECIKSFETVKKEIQSDRRMSGDVRPRHFCLSIMCLCLSFAQAAGVYHGTAG